MTKDEDLLDQVHFVHRRLSFVMQKERTLDPPGCT
jgi:hypothetical protein